MFIHIKPEEARTIQRIPRALLFPAPGLPKGHLLLGYSDNGNCPMLVDNQCSIYEDRPQTCRDYDCRIFAATGVAVDEQTQAEIADRVRAWVFDYNSEESREEHGMVKEAAAFLQKNSGCFRPEAFPAIQFNWPAGDSDLQAFLRPDGKNAHRRIRLFGCGNRAGDRKRVESFDATKRE